MTAFIAIAVVLTLLALLWLVRPLLWPAAASAGVSSRGLNASIYRDQLEALERDLARGVISAQECEAGRDELQLRLLDDVEEAPGAQAVASSFWSGRRTAAVIALLVPLGSGGMYWWLGTPEAIDPVASQKASNDQVATMVEALAARLKANPDNPKGWAMLARSYKVMGRFADAEQAFLKAGELVTSDPDLLVDFADLLAVRNNNNIEGKPLELVKKALSLNPKHPMGLMMSGVAAYRRSDFGLAVVEWEKLLLVLDPGSPDAQQVEADIAEARSKAGLPASTSSSAARPRPATAESDATKLAPVDPAAATAMTPEKINQMVESLAARLKTNPDDLNGWVRLARTYKAMSRLPEAEQAFEKAAKLVDSDPDLLTQFADVLAMRTNTLEGRPLTLVNKALTLNPKHPMALMLAASAAFRRADYKLAISHWEKALSVLPAGSSDAKQIEAEIAEARSKAGLGLQLKGKP